MYHFRKILSSNNFYKRSVYLNLKKFSDSLSDQSKNEIKNNLTVKTIESNSNQLTKLKEINLNQFTEDIKNLSLSECLQKYEYTIEEILSLDPKIQTRVLVKGFVYNIKIFDDKVKVDIVDNESLKKLVIFIPKPVFQDYENTLKLRSSIVLTGLTFKNEYNNNVAVYSDKILFANQSSKKLIHKILKNKDTILQWFDLREFPTSKFLSLKIACLIKFRSSLINEIHQIMNEEKFLHVTPPILSSFPLSDQVFTISSKKYPNYFEDEVYLKKYSDKHLESIVYAIPQIYTITHSFTSNNIRSKQISNEIINLEVSQATDDNLNNLLDQVEYFLKKLNKNIKEKNTKELKYLHGLKHKDYTKINNENQSFFRLTYEEALKILIDKNVNFNKNEKLTFYHKKVISNFFENYPIFIYNLPFDIKEDFDTKKTEDNKALKFELILEDGYTVGQGKIKNTCYNELEENLKKLNLDLTKENISWYLDLRKKGPLPNTWFNLFLDTYIKIACQLPSLRDTILFPRMPNFCNL